jgi:hypothetical protein
MTQKPKNIRYEARLIIPEGCWIEHLNDDDIHFVPNPAEGHWVRYSDYEKLKKEFDDFKAEHYKFVKLLQKSK